MAIPTVNYKSVEDKPLAWDSPGLLIFRFIAPDRDWNDRSELNLIAKAFENLCNNSFSMHLHSFLLETMYFQTDQTIRPEQTRLPDQSRPDQTRPRDQTRPGQTRPDHQTRPDQARPDHQSRQEQSKPDYQTRPSDQTKQPDQTTRPDRPDHQTRANQTT